MNTKYAVDVNDTGLLSRAQEIRRQFHRIPEAGLSEFKTRAQVLAYLQNLGAVIYDDVFHTGLVAHFEYVKGAPTLGFRADMDALSMIERTDHDFKSIHEGFMHACGHDGHMTMLVLLAEHLSALKLSHHNIALFFQPAEEGPGGAAGMIESGILQKLNVVEMYGIHLFPGLPMGTVGTKAGPLMAATSEMRILFKGVSCHGAQPHAGCDSLVAGASFLLNAQTIVSRNISPMESAVVSFGVFKGGERVNIIAPQAFLEGTMRSFNPRVHALIQERLKELAQATAMAHNVDYHIVFTDLYPAVINDGQLAQMVLKNVPGALEVEAEMLAEDFSYFGEHVPSLFMFLGTETDHNGKFPLHSNQFDFDEKVLLYGLEAYMQIIAIKEGHK